MLIRVDIKLTFVRGSDALCLMTARGNAGFKVKMVDASVLIRKVNVSSAVILGHAKALEKGNANTR